MFFVVVSVCITSNNLKNEDPAKSDCFCDFYAFSKCRVRTSLCFNKGVPASKKVGNLCCTTYVIMAQDKYQEIFIINVLELIIVKKCCNM